MNSPTKLPEICETALADHLRPDLFKALCDPVRISIVATLAARTEPATVSELTECCGIDFSGVSRHLKMLREAGIVTTEKRGREVLHQLDANDLAQNLRSIADAIDVCGTGITPAD